MPTVSSPAHPTTMEQHSFEGQLENINPGQLEFIKNVIEEQGFKESKVTIEAAGGVADNYAANVKRITVEGDNGSLSMIAKIAPTQELLRKTLNVPIMFGNEILIYSEILPKFLSLQKQAEVAEEDLLQFPKCYGTNSEAPNEVILIEDLKETGFGMLDKFTSLTNECVNSVLRNLAIYHSLSYVLKSKEPETYNYYKDNLQDMWGALAEGSPEQIGYFGQLEAMSTAMIDDPELKGVMKNKVVDVVTRAAKMAKFENGSRYAVIQHGDCWTNNIMFKFEDEALQQSVLIDYQLSKNSSPASDLLYFIFNCTDHESRVQNFYNWLDYYHLELDKALSNYGLKANYVYPRDQFDADLKRYGKLAFGLCIVVSGATTINPEEAVKFKEAMGSGDMGNLMNTMTDLHSDTIVVLKKKLTGLVQSYVAFGLL